jgi:HSP20 family protein
MTRFPIRRGDLARLWGNTDRYVAPGWLWHDWPALRINWPSVFEGEFLAPVEVFDRDGHTVVKMELPGVTMEDIDISLADGVLTIKGEKKYKEETEEQDYYRCETSYGSFHRRFAVPQGLDGSKISATYDNGVLEVLLPKVEEQQEHKVEVKAKAKKTTKARAKK